MVLSGGRRKRAADFCPKLAKQWFIIINFFQFRKITPERAGRKFFWFFLLFVSSNPYLCMTECVEKGARLSVAGRGCHGI